MAEGSNAGPRRHSRANWVALRTLRQLPKVVGENSVGEPIVEIRSVRLVLRDGASHFSRVTTCSKCEREVPGAPVLSPADLDHPPHPVICRDCVRNAAAPVLASGGRPRAPAPEPVAKATEGSPQGDGDRVAALERRIAELSDLVLAQRAELEAAFEQRVEDTRVEVRSFATKELARAQEDVDRMMKGVVERAGRVAPGADTGGAQAVEAKLGRSLERLSQRLDEQRAELLADVDARLAQVQATVEDAAARPASQIEELRVTVEALARRLEDATEAGERVAALEARMSELRAERQRVEGIEARMGELEAQLAEQVTSDRARLDVLETQVRESQTSLEAEVARVGARLDAAPDRERVDAVEAHLRELRGILGAEAARITERLAEQATSERARVDAVEAQLRDLAADIGIEAARFAEEASFERLDRLEAALREARTEAAADAARIEAEVADGLATAGRRLDERLEELAPDRARLDGLEAGLESLEAAVAERVRPIEESLADAARVEEALAERLDRQAERLRRPAGDDGRLQALEQRLDEAVERLAGLVESQRLEFQEEMRSGLAEARMAMAADQRGGGRLKKLEDAAAQRDARLAELMELQTTLDTGLGELRTEIERLRESATQAPRADQRLHETVEIPQLPAVEPERGRRGARKSADAVAGLTAAVQRLLDDHRGIRAELATLQNEAETAVKASARASAQATSVAPIRQDLRALRDEVAAQDRAVAALAKRVETLAKAGKPPAPAGPKPAAKAIKVARTTTTAAKTTTTAEAATKASKASKSTKASKVAKATRTTKKV